MDTTDVSSGEHLCRKRLLKDVVPLENSSLVVEIITWLYVCVYFVVVLSADETLLA